jgi:CDP-diacylglycerol---serine O-phosphatidyltransferase
VNPANALTLLSAASALTGLFTLVAYRGPFATPVALTCVGASLLLDRFDGAVARRLGLTSPMGAMLDSLADLLAFGALPAALLVARSPTLVAAVCAMLYALAAVWRLARYDGDELTESRWGPCFKGVPTSASGSAMIVAVSVETLAPATRGLALAAALAMAALMPSTVRYPKRGIGAWPWMVLVPMALVAQWVMASR